FRTLMIMSGTILLIFFGLHLLHQWSFFKKHKKIFMVAIYILFFGFIFVSLYQTDSTEAIPGTGIIDSESNPIFVGFHEIFIAGNRLSGWLKVAGWILTVLILGYITFRWIIPQLY